MSATVKQGQTLFDIALQYCGGADAAFGIARLNNRNLTDELAPGEVLQMPDVRNKRVVKYYADYKLIPASAVIEKKEGIGYWIIQSDFITT